MPASLYNTNRYIIKKIEHKMEAEEKEWA